MAVVAVDSFSSQSPGLNSPAIGGELVTPSDSNQLTKVTRGIALTVAGAVSVVMQDGSTFVIPNGSLAIGIIHPLRIKQVKSTGTDPGVGVVAYW